MWPETEAVLRLQVTIYLERSDLGSRVSRHQGPNLGKNFQRQRLRPSSAGEITEWKGAEMPVFCVVFCIYIFDGAIFFLFSETSSLRNITHSMQQPGARPRLFLLWQAWAAIFLPAHHRQVSLCPCVGARGTAITLTHRTCEKKKDHARLQSPVMAEAARRSCLPL